MSQSPPGPETPSPRLPHEVPVAKRVGNEPPVVVVQQPRTWGRMFGWLGWLALLLCLPVIFGMVAAYRDYYDTSQGIQERYHSLSRQARDKVAVIDVSGVVMDGEGFVKRQIDRVRQDPSVRAVVVRINSPGGTITGSDYIYHHLCQLREQRDLPLVVSMGSMAASGGYYIAMAVGDTEDSVFAEPTTTTGSIGVIIPHYDLSGLLEKLDVKDDSIVTHPRKQMLSMTKPLSPEDREILERYINDAFQRFKDVVKQGRPLFREDQQALDEVATGEIFVASNAQQQGLVDQLGFVEDAIDRAIELAGLEKANVRVVSFKEPLTLSSLLASARLQPADGWSDWVQLTSPRAYYLCTSLPPLAASWRR